MTTSSVERPSPQIPTYDYRLHVNDATAPDLDRGGPGFVRSYAGHRVLRTLIRARFSPLHSTGQQYIYSGDAYGGLFIYDVLSGKVGVHAYVQLIVAHISQSIKSIASGKDGVGNSICLI